ncbi:DUF927 domain-containing protein [Salmonella enterica]|nr:DUF927 domain-containing protein [Salmonella enterica]EEA0373588.1 DUF927 domain-containing protein [Salmonella enterica]
MTIYGCCKPKGYRMRLLCTEVSVMKNIDLIREVTQAAAGQWPFVLRSMNISVPDSPRKHAACPVCGGKDRFRFDDNGRGSFICNQCGAGDGLDLIKKVNNCNATDAAVMVADVLSIDYRAAETDDSASQRNDQREAERRKHEQDRQKQAAAEAEKRRAAFSAKYQALVAQSTPGQSAYLTVKGLEYPLSLLPDGSLLLALTNGDGAVTGAQTIKPDGEKRLVAGTVKKGSFFIVNSSDNPQAVIIGEGLATVLSVHLMRPDALAVVAVDAGNLLPVAKVMRGRYPDAKIIIAADNDIRPGEPNTGRDAAEKAAISVSGWLTLPPGKHKSDWNDYHQANGPEAATAAFNDSMYQPEGEKLAVKLKAIDGGKQEQQNGKKRVIPGDELKPRVELRKDGLNWVTPKVDKQSGEMICPGEWLSDRMKTVGIGNDGKEAYLIIEMVPEGTGKIIYEAMPRHEIGMPAGWARLRGRGVSITTQSQLLNRLAEYLQREGERTVWEVTSTAGWHCGAYVMPDGEIIGTPERPVAFCGGSAAIRGYVVRGNAAEWRDHVASLMQGNHSMMLGVLVGLSAPLNSLAGGGSFGVHLFAQSSAGKTTTVEAATSLYGDPEMLKLSWDATRHGLTVEAAARNDGFIPIDEIGQGGKVTEIAQAAYSLFNGVGRIQGRKEGGNRPTIRWKIAALSTGEEDFEAYLVKGGMTPKAGQLVRLLSVPFTDTLAFNGCSDGDEHAKAIKQMASRYCGAAGREWIRWLADNKETALHAVAEKESEWARSLPDEASSQVRRVASRFALMDAAGELAAGITGWTPEESSEAVHAAFDSWVNDFGLENREKYQVITRARDFIQRYGLTRFQPYSFGKINGDMDRQYAGRINNLAGYLVSGRRKDGLPEYHIIPSVFDEEILCGISRNFGGKVLEDAGMLTRQEPGRLTSKTLTINETQQRFVVLIDQPEE